MPLIERDVAMSHLKPYLSGVPQAFRRAWKRARSIEPLDLLDLSKTTRAGLMRDFSVAELARYWSGDPNVYSEEFSQQLLFVVEQRFALRVKKADRSSCSSNYATDQDQNFRGQGQIEGMPPCYNFELQYVLNAPETDLEDIRIACLNGDEPYWWQSIERPADNMYDLFQNQRDPNPPGPTYTPKPDETRPDVTITIKPKKT